VQYIVILLVGLAGGAAVGVQSTMSGAMSGRLGALASSFIIHMGGAVVSAVLLMGRGGENIQDWRSMPSFVAFAGALGVFLTVTLGFTFPRLGVGGAVTLLIVGQLIMVMVIDHFGWFGVTPRPIDLGRAVAAVLLIVGGYLMTRQ
jgi:bacterial/archaeal transporter family-2 protein